MFHLSPGHKIAGIWKRRHSIAFSIQRRISARVVKVEMSIDNDGYAIRLDTGNRAQ
jgi:hypothetical protein